MLLHIFNGYSDFKAILLNWTLFAKEGLELQNKKEKQRKKRSVKGKKKKKKKKEKKKSEGVFLSPKEKLPRSEMNADLLPHFPSFLKNGTNGWFISVVMVTPLKALNFITGVIAKSKCSSC